MTDPTAHTAAELLAQPAAAIVTVDTNGNIITWSAHATQWFGHAAGDVIGRPVALLVPAAFRDAHRHGLERAMSGGERHLQGAATHLPVLHANGTIVVHPARFHHLTNAHDQLVGATAVFGPPNPNADPWSAI